MRETRGRPVLKVWPSHFFHGYRKFVRVNGLFDHNTRDGLIVDPIDDIK